MWDFFVENILFGLISLAIGVVVTLLARTRTTRRLSYVAAGSASIENLPFLQARSVEGEQWHSLERLTVWRVRIWNSGNVPIRRSELRGLKLMAPDCEYVFAWLAGITNEANDVRLEDFTLSFDYLNPGDGFDVAVLHNASEGQLDVLAGDIVGGEIKYGGAERDKIISIPGSLFLVGILQMMWLYVFLTIDKSLPDRETILAALDTKFWLVSAVIVATGVVMIVMSVGERRARRLEPHDSQMRPHTPAQTASDDR